MKNLKNKQFRAVASIFIITLFFLGCENSGKVTGIVIDGVSKQPVPNAQIIAETNINIVEDKKFEHSTAICDEKGEFLLKGLSPKYKYKITATKQGYTLDDATAVPPEEGQTYMLEKPLEIINIPPGTGAFAYSENNYSPLTKVKFKTIRSKYQPDRAYDYIDNMQNILAADKMIVFYGEYSQYLNIYPLTRFDGDVTLPFSNNHSVTMTANNILVTGVNPPNLRIFNYYKVNATRFNAPSGLTVGGYGTLSGSLPSNFFEYGKSTIYAIDVSYLNSGIYTIKYGGQAEGWLFQIL